MVDQHGMIFDNPHYSMMHQEKYFQGGVEMSGTKYYVAVFIAFLTVVISAVGIYLVSLKERQEQESLKKW